VPDQARFLAACRCIALATRAGTGVQLKTLEAFQLGKPTVATPLALRGFSEHPANLRIAEGPGEFAQALAAMAADARAGRIGDIDGAAFVASQKEAMLSSIATGLGALSPP
jgi:hypothetical protein